MGHVANLQFLYDAFPSEFKLNQRTLQTLFAIEPYGNSCLLVLFTFHACSQNAEAGLEIVFTLHPTSQSSLPVCVNFYNRLKVLL